MIIKLALILLVIPNNHEMQERTLFKIKASKTSRKNCLNTPLMLARIVGRLVGITYRARIASLCY